MWTSDIELFGIAKNELFPALVGDVLDKLGYTHQFLSPDLKPIEKSMITIGRAMPVLEADVFIEKATDTRNELMSKPFGLMFEALDSLKENDRSEAHLHRKVFRPWGWYDSVDFGERFQVKRIVVKPGATLSLQMHHHRTEHWIVVRGTAKVTRGDEIFLVAENESTYIPIGTQHRLENPGCVPLEMIEVQSGSYLGEDDIVRFEDIYGRTEH